MARTYRDTQENNNYDYYRHPKTHNELSKLNEILHDDEVKNYNISGLNHLKSREHYLLTS